ncbi:MAG: hypothetical protein ACREX9_12160 [Gammaproteobacteria bacterium]
MGATNDHSRLHLKIFLSSPSDVCDERALARTVLERLSQEYALRRRIHIEEVSWDDPGAPVPMDAHLTPQEAIDKRRPKPSQCDIVVVVLWSRMGTPLPPEHRKPDGRRYVSGIEYEFCDAMDAAKRTGKPTTLVYRRTEEPKIGLGDRDLDEKHRQYKAVQTFFAEFTGADGSLRQSYAPYGSPSEFADNLERALRELIQVELEALPKEAPVPLKDDASEAAIARDTTAKSAWQGNPYRGLKAFRKGCVPPN